jgi:hypothetical protein
MSSIVRNTIILCTSKRKKEGDVSKNGRVKHLKIPSSIKAMKTLVKIVRSNFFRALEINQRFSAIWGVFI